MGRQLTLISTGPKPEPTLPRLRLSSVQIVRAGIQYLGKFFRRTGPLTLAGSVLAIEIFREPREEEAIWALGQCLLCCLAVLTVGTLTVGAREALRVISTELEFTQTHLIIREGILIQREHTLPRHKIVEVEASQDVVAAVLSLADVQIATGPGRYSDGIKVCGFEYRDALALEKFLVGAHADEVERRHRAWG